MKKKISILVKFKCCDTEHHFTQQGEFKMCLCGSSGFDAGDEFMCRTIGLPENIEIIDKNILDKS